MAYSMVVFKIFPDEPGTENAILEQIKKLTDSNCVFKDSKIEPLAFGMNSIKVAFTLERVDGLSEALLAKIQAIPSVSQVEVEAMSLL